MLKRVFTININFWFALCIVAISLYVGIVVGAQIKSDSKPQPSTTTLTPTIEISGWEAKGAEVRYNPYDVAIRIKGNRVSGIFYKIEGVDPDWLDKQFED